jgi:hypothetical protein
MSSSAPNFAVDSEVEAAYADIGRSVVEMAMKQSSEVSPEGTIEASVKVRLSLGGGDVAARPGVVCCVCTMEDGVIICRGPCCPGF